MTNDNVPAGWYPDPDDGGASQRFWDGAKWTEQTRFSERPRPTPQSAPPSGQPFPGGQQGGGTTTTAPAKKKSGLRIGCLALLGLLGLLILIVVVVVVAIRASGGSSTTSSPGSTATSSGDANKSSIDHLSDYKITSCASDPTTGYFAAKVNITNTSSKTSNYLGTLAWVSPDGKTQFDTSPLSANNLAPGQTASVDGLSLKPAQPGAICKIVDSTRLAAN